MTPDTSEAVVVLRVMLAALPVGAGCTFANGCTVRRVSKRVYEVTSPRYGVALYSAPATLEALTNADFYDLVEHDEEWRRVNLWQSFEPELSERKM